MMTRWFLLSLLAGALCTVPAAQGTGPSPDALRFGSPPRLSSESSREAMWPAPTAEDWKKPCLIQWERTFDDALRVARQTGKPILACVNMDGEIASEHFAGIKYRREETAVFYEPYVCVIASVYRHNPRDYDEDGRRIPCPRFGTVTCGEHIAIEPILFERFFDGKRIAPRHIEIEADGRESYDVYYAWDTQSIFTALRYGVADRPPPDPDAFGDRPPLDRVSSPRAVDRTVLETAYVQGTRQVRRALIEATLTHRDVDQVDLLRLAIFGFDVELARLARKALARCDSESAVDLIAEALKVPMTSDEREELLAAAERLGAKYPRARTLVAVHRGLAGASKLISAEGWASAGEERGEAAARRAYDTAAELERREREREAHPDDARANLELAASLLARAHDAKTDRRFVGVLLEDARRTARTAEQQGARGWRVNALLACTASALGDGAEALARAVAAVEGGMPAPGTGDGSLSDPDAVTVLSLFARARQRAIAKAYRERTAWPPEWLSDIHAAYAVLSQHPLGTDEHVVSLFDFLEWLGATPRAAEVLDEGLRRFPESALLHDRLRSRLLREKGPDGLEAAYDARLAVPEPPRNLEWFAGYASLVAAEHHRRAGKFAEALAAYGRGLRHYENALARNPDCRDSADHYAALAHAGRARVALDEGALARATEELLASFARRADSAASPDGLNISAVDTAKMLRARLLDAGDRELAARLQAGLDALDPRLLELPAYERAAPDRPRRRPERQGG